MSTKQTLALLLALILYLVYTYPPLSAIILVLSIRQTPFASLFMSFILGIIVDILTGSPIGSHAIFFLIMTQVIILYLRKVSGESLWYVGIASMVFALSEQIILVHQFNILLVLLTPFWVLLCLQLTRSTHQTKKVSFR